MRVKMIKLLRRVSTEDSERSELCRFRVGRARDRLRPEGIQLFRRGQETRISSLA